MILSPLGIEMTEGKRRWETARNDPLARIVQDVLIGYEMGFADAQIDPWAPRGAALRWADVLPYEADEVDDP